MEFGPHLLLAMLEGAVTAAVLSLTAVGLSLVFGIMRVVNVAHGEFYMLGAILAWFVATTLGGSAALGFVAALVVAPSVVGGLAALTALTPLKRIAYDHERTLLVPIALHYVIQQVALMTDGPTARPAEPPFNTRIALPWFAWGEVGFALYYPWGLSTTSYKLAVICAAAVAVLGAGA